MLLKENVSHPGQCSPYLVRGHVTPLPHWKGREMKKPGLAPERLHALSLRKEQEQNVFGFPQGKHSVSFFFLPFKKKKNKRNNGGSKKSHTAHQHLTKNRTWVT